MTAPAISTLAAGTSSAAPLALVSGGEIVQECGDAPRLARMASHDRIEYEHCISYAERIRAEYEKQLADLVGFPTVSALDEHRPDIAAAADHTVALLRSLGLRADLLHAPSGGGNPVVHAVLSSDPSHPTVTVYNHLDVQPADRVAEGWTTEPFVMQIDGDTYRGRGTTDDKGPALAALHGALLARKLGVPINVHFLWELEEEIGSPSFAAIVAQNTSRLATQSVVVSDTVWVSRERPAAPAGLRGLQGFLLRLRTGDQDAHSGLAGGLARNPIAELAQLISECFDARSGEVKIPGFYDAVVAPTAREIEDFAASGFSVDRFMRDHRLQSVRTRDPIDAMQRLWARPTFEVHGIKGGYQQQGIKTVVPPFAEAKVSCRLVPNQSAAGVIDCVRSFVQRVAPDVEVVPQVGLEPFRGQTTGPLPDAIRAAIQFGFGRQPVFVREGGAIGAVVSMHALLHAPVMFLGLSLPEHGYHAPNENFDWAQARGGIAAFCEYFRRVAELPRART